MAKVHLDNRTAVSIWLALYDSMEMQHSHIVYALQGIRPMISIVDKRGWPRSIPSRLSSHPAYHKYQCRNFMNS